MTITLISIIVFFIVTEIPANFVSRTRAVTLIFFGSYSVSNSNVVEIIRAICTILGALNVTINFLLYYLFCPPFCRALRLTFMKSSPRNTENVCVNVIVLNENNSKIANLNAKVLEIARGSIRSPIFKSNEKSLKQRGSFFAENIYDFADDNFSSTVEHSGYCKQELSTTTTVREEY